MYHNELTEIAKKSQDLHAVIVEKINAIKKDQTEADSLHQSFVRAKEQNNLLYEQIRQLMGQSTGIRSSLREQYQTRRKEEIPDEKTKMKSGNKNKKKKQLKSKRLKRKSVLKHEKNLNVAKKLTGMSLHLMIGNDEEDEAETQA